MLDEKIFGAVTSIVTEVVDQEALSRLGRLKKIDVREKGVDGPVTIADTRVERRLDRELRRLLPESIVVGEEAVAIDRQLLTTLRSEQPIWIIDPIDGTSNFVAADPNFATLVALSLRDRLIASWIYAPALGVLATAWQGHGSKINGRPATVCSFADGHILRVAVTNFRYQTDEDRSLFKRLEHPNVRCTACDCVGLCYLDLVRGRHHAAVFTWENPWDHAAGLMFHGEAGGHSSTMDGVPFQPSGGNALPILVASDRNRVHLLRELLS